MNGPITYHDLPEGFRQFVDEHINDDVAMLRLKFHGDQRLWLPDAITHIECLRKCKGKFGVLQPDLMLSPLSVEQATSEKVAKLHADIAMGLLAERPGHILDMTCGIGIDLRAISGAVGCQAIGIELDPTLAAAGAYNFRKIPNVEIVNGDSVEWLKEWEGEKFGLIFIDPARRGNAGERVFNIHHCQPDIAELLPLLAGKCHHAMVKLSPMLDVTQTLRDLPPTAEIHITDENGECRELLAVLNFTESQALIAPSITIHSGNSSMTFTPEEESLNTRLYGDAIPGQWLFEPSPAAMKAKPFGTLCCRHGLRQLHPNTNLFTSEHPTNNLPGKWYAIEDVFDFSSSSIKQLGKRIAQADIATRNFPLKAEELQKRLKVKPGGCNRLIGATIGQPGCNERRMLLMLRKNATNQ